MASVTDGGSAQTAAQRAATAAKAAAIAKQVKAAKAAAARVAAAKAAKAASAQQRVAAKAAADHHAAQAAAIAAARRAAYEDLAQKQIYILRQAGIIKPSLRPAVPPKTVVQQPKQAPKPVYVNGQPVTHPVDETIDELHRQQYAQRVMVTQRKASIEAAATGQSSAAQMEAALASASKYSNGTGEDNKTIETIATKYVAQAEQVASKYKKLVDLINRAIDKKDMKTARALYGSKEFAALASEYVRLFGDGKHAGAVNQFFANYQALGQTQAEWWKRQVHSQLAASQKTIADQMAQARADGDSAKWKQLSELNAIYHGSTGQVIDHYVTDAHNVRTPVYRQRTIQEELDYRDAQKQIQMEHQRAIMELGNRQAQLDFQHDDGAMQRKAIEGDLQRVVQTQFGGTAPPLKSSTDLMGFADKMMGDWEQRHPKPMAVGRAGGPAFAAQIKSWEADRSAYERSVYSYFGGSTPAFWDRAMALPGVSGALAILQGPVSSIGAGSRVLLKAATGTSQSFEISLSDLPDSVKQKLGIGGPVAGLIDLGAHVPVFGSSSQGQQQLILNQWFQTPEGKAWYAAESAKHKAKSQAQDNQFNEGFYGNGDLGAKLDALNQYGQQPTNNDMSNLMFQLLADPTNAIPLKFTTYLARAKYAAEAGDASKFLGSSKFGSVRDFVKVDEGTLRLRSEIKKVLTASGKDGASARQLTDSLLADVAGIGDQGARAKAIREKLAAAGISPREVNDTQLFSLVESSIKDRLAHQGIDYASQKAEMEAKMAAHQAETEVADAARLAKQVKQEAVNAAGAEKRLAAAKQSRAQLAKSKKAAEDQAVAKMTEAQYWKHISEQSRAILKDDAATAAAKRDAKAVLREVESARYAKAAGVNKRHVPAAERNRFVNRVNALHGNAAEDLIAPKSVAPYVEDARGVAVEQTRSYLRQLRGAAPEDVASSVKTAGEKLTQDHFPIQLYNKVETEISDALYKLRGKRNELLTGKRGRKSTGESSGLVGRLSDKDPEVIRVKKEILDRHGVTVAAYDEARKVLRSGYVGAKNSSRLMKQARELAAAGGETYQKAFTRLRTAEARAEGRRQLGALAGGELYGHAPDEVMAEFISRYGDDGLLRGYKPELSAFQRRTLEEHIKELSGVKDLADQKAMSQWLLSRNAPPLASRELTREFLITIGAWSPRRAEQFTAGAASWSVEQEAKFWFDAYGVVPDWANAYKLADPTEFNMIFHDQGIYGKQMQEWGIFNRSAELKLRLSGQTAQEIEDRALKGDPALGLKGKRELELQRKYVVERYGSLVGTMDEHGATHLTSMPWLMDHTELRPYFASRVGRSIADDLVRDAGELDEVTKLIDKSMDKFWDKYIGPAAADGPVAYEDVFRLASEVQARLLADPKWARRLRDVTGDLLNGWASVNRALVFTNPAFAVANIVDVPIKTAWYRFTRRGLFNPSLVGVAEDVAKRAQELVPQDFGLDLQTTIYREKQRPVADYLKNPRANTPVLRAAERASGLVRGAFRFQPAIAADVEIAGKMRLARGMWPTVYGDALKKLGDAGLADAFSRKFIKQEMVLMWPTVGEGPLEGLFNQLVPFASYSIRNKLLFIGEAVAHPVVLNQIEFVGRFIEEHNRANWEKEHPGEPLPDQMARRIELPWAPGYFLDLGQFSDATRGLKPIYQTGQHPTSYLDAVGAWMRIVNPGTQAGILMLTNALGVTQRIQWQPIVDESGFVTGYRKVLTGWTEPWSEDQPTLGSVIWLADVFAASQKMGAGGWTNGEVSVLLGKLSLFDAVSQVDRGAGLYEYYKALRLKDKAFAERWLSTSPDGQLLQDWMSAKIGAPKDVADWLSVETRNAKDPNFWFHTQSASFQKAVRDGYTQIENIRTDYEQKLLRLDPKSQEYRDTKAKMLFYISEVYRLTPELMTNEVYSKTPAEWSAQLQKWQTNMKLDEFFKLDDQRPDRKAFKTDAAYQSALDAWNHQKEVFLATYPTVSDTLGTARSALDQVRAEQEAEWTKTLNDIGKRNGLIDAALKVGDHDRADQLYLANELDYSVLNHDHVALYYQNGDLKDLPNGGTSVVHNVLRQAKVLLDFDAARYAKAVREGRGQQYLDDAYYAQGMQDVILKAKGGDKFGKFDPSTFLKELRKHPRLLALYFAKHPGKKAQWARADAYVRAIGPWGQAASSGQWDKAQKLWDALPKWVQDQYLSKHARSGKAVATANYIGWIQRWAKTFDSPDRAASMKFFWSMPKDVRERYFAKHPQNRIKWEAQLKFGDQLGQYFAADKAMQPAYLKAHPELAKWLAKNVSTKQATTWGILAGYAALPKDDAWLKRIYRDKYPQVFSKQATGEGKLHRVFDKLAAHPEFTQSFEKWRDTIMASYLEMLQHSAKIPKWWTSDHSNQRRGSGGLSAAETSR